MGASWLFAAVIGLGACHYETGVGPKDGSTKDDGSSSDDASDAEIVDVLGGDASALGCNAADLDLRACYPFDGTTIDRSSYGNNAVASAPGYVMGRSGLALLTSTGTVNVPNTTSLDITELTIRAWINPTVLPTGSARMGIVDSPNRWRLFVLGDGALRCALTNGAEVITATGKLTTGVWQRVTCTYDGAQMFVYVNGAVAGSANVVSAFGLPGTGMTIGHNNPSGENFVGAIDDLQIWGSIVGP